MIRLCDLRVVIPAALVAVGCAFITGRFVLSQASVNFNDAATIEKAVATLPESPVVSIGVLEPIGDELTDYNRSILNARLLNLYTLEEQEQVADPYLQSLVSKVKNLTKVPMAARKWGAFFAVGVGFISMFLYFNVTWLSLNGIRLGLEKWENRGRHL